MDHLGGEVESTDQVDAASQRLTGEGMETLVETARPVATRCRTTSGSTARRPRDLGLRWRSSPMCRQTGHSGRASGPSPSAARLRWQCAPQSAQIPAAARSCPPVEPVGAQVRASNSG
jgi:hypothetical protein